MADLATPSVALAQQPSAVTQPPTATIVPTARLELIVAIPVPPTSAPTATTVS
ncbi:hypothetical protein HC891_22080, partial [Candidatus Gracilibacteria bacterium]|nr:hypothetical protein [Candidatus Gracilibacteria bacterium]